MGKEQTRLNKVKQVLNLDGDKSLNKRKEEKRKNRSSVKKRRSRENREIELFNQFNIEGKSDEANDGKKKSKMSNKKKRKSENRENEIVNQFNIEGKSDEANDGKKKSKMPRNKKRKGEKIVEAEISKIGKLYNEAEDGFDEKSSTETKEKKKSKSRKKKRNNEKLKKAEVNEVDELYNDVEDGSDQRKDEGKMEAIHSATQGPVESPEGQHKVDFETNFSNRSESKKTRKIKKKDNLSQNNDGLLEKREEAEQDEVYQISSGDEDCSLGMKKWIMEYHQSRPGFKILQQRIDDFIVAHEAQEEQARKEREARAAEGGWTVVVHHKGRKKTTDSESGIAVGSVSQAVVMDKMAKKKKKEVGLDFYRFQKREAQRNEIMMLQSKFEQDKKRIQQMRAARKFRPY